METAIEGEVVIDEGDLDEVQRLPAVRASEAIVARDEISPGDVLAQRDKIKQVMALVMTKGIHYGEIPGVSKPTLLKPGAEVLAVTFRLATYPDSERTFHGDGHLTVVSKVTLKHIPTGLVVAQGEGLCTTYEKKYAYRTEGRVCPACEQPYIKKSKYPPRANDYPGADPKDPPGWYCHGKVGGCGANFRHDDPAIVDQETGRVANPDLPDAWNTILKMADKRALVAAILNGTAASDIFTQDVEDQAVAATAETETWDAPKNWKQIGQRLQGHLGDDTAAWIADALRVGYGVETTRELEAGEEKQSAGKKLSGVIYELDAAAEGGGNFPPLDDEQVRTAFAKHFEGAWIPGPRGPESPPADREGRESLEGVEGAEASGDAAGAGSTSEDDIPF